MRERPRLVGVRIIPWEMSGNVFGIASEFDDHVEVREKWGTFEETLQAATLRKQDIVSVITLKHAS